LLKLTPEGVHPDMANAAAAANDPIDTALNPAFMTDLLVADFANLLQHRTYGNRPKRRLGGNTLHPACRAATGTA
jgi:hypothetical protein